MKSKGRFYETVAVIGTLWVKMLPERMCRKCASWNEKIEMDDGKDAYWYVKTSKPVIQT